jgi:hypothetical protein
VEPSHLLVKVRAVHGQPGQVPHDTLDLGPPGQPVAAQDGFDRLVADCVGHVVLAADLGADPSVGRAAGGAV